MARAAVRDVGSISTGRVLALAQYFRTFPPEDGCSAVATLPGHSWRGRRALFHELVRHARSDGMRTLSTVVSQHDSVTLQLLREANPPIRYNTVSGGMYVEIDLLAAAGQY
jgi:hypothetical protein